MVAELEVSTRELILTLLLKEGQASATNLASSVDISVQAMRRHLRSLEMERLIKSNLISFGPGRPFNLWELTSEGIEHFNNSRSNEKLALELLASIKNSLAPEVLEKILLDSVIDKASFYKNQIGPGNIAVRL